MSTALWRKPREHKLQEGSKAFQAFAHLKKKMPDASAVSTVDFILKPVYFYTVYKDRPAPLLPSEVAPIDPIFPMLLYIYYKMGKEQNFCRRLLVPLWVLTAS